MNEYRKLATIEVVDFEAVCENGMEGVKVQNKGDSSDQWIIQSDVFQETYGPVESEPTTFVERLQVETREMVDRKVKLQNFLGGKIFPTLIRRKKHLLYKQDRLMSKLLEVLGERIELEGSQYKVSDDGVADEKDGKGLK